MGLIGTLAVVCLLFLAADAAAIAKGEKNLAVCLTAVIAVGLISLWLLWIVSPM